MIHLDDIIVGQEIEILRGRHKGEIGIIVDYEFDDEGKLIGDQINVQIKGTKIISYLGCDDIKLIDPYKLFSKRIIKENKNNKMNETTWNKFRGVFKTNAQKFKELFKDDDNKTINKVFDNVFKHALNGRFGELRQKWAERMLSSEKYDLMKQGMEIDNLRAPDFIQNRNGGFKYTTQKLESPFSNARGQWSDTRESQVSKSNTNKLVVESLDELHETKKAKQK